MENASYTDSSHSMFYVSTYSSDTFQDVRHCLTVVSTMCW